MSGIPEAPTAAHCCDNDSNFGIIHSFLGLFSEHLDTGELNISELRSMLENTEKVHPALEDLHIKLLRKIKKNVPVGKWETTLAKFAHTYSLQDAWEIERFGYKKANLAVKLRILKELLERQFDVNSKFKTRINSCVANDLRLSPLGRDSSGNSYWYFMDAAANVQIYQSNAANDSWEVIAKNREQFANLIEALKNNRCTSELLLANRAQEEHQTASSGHGELVEPAADEGEPGGEEQTVAKQVTPSLILSRRTYKVIEKNATADVKDEDDDGENNDEDYDDGDTAAASGGSTAEEDLKVATVLEVDNTDTMSHNEGKGKAKDPCKNEMKDTIEDKAAYDEGDVTISKVKSEREETINDDENVEKESKDKVKDVIPDLTVKDEAKIDVQHAVKVKTNDKAKEETGEEVKNEVKEKVEEEPKDTAKENTNDIVKEDSKDEIKKTDEVKHKVETKVKDKVNVEVESTINIASGGNSISDTTSSTSAVDANNENPETTKSEADIEETKTEVKSEPKDDSEGAQQRGENKNKSDFGAKDNKTSECQKGRENDKESTVVESDKDTKQQTEAPAVDEAEKEAFSEAIDDPPLVVQGEGNGEDCESVCYPVFSEVIEEPILFVYGCGSGVDNCMGNTKKMELTKSAETAKEPESDEEMGVAGKRKAAGKILRKKEPVHETDEEEIQKRKSAANNACNGGRDSVKGDNAKQGKNEAMDISDSEQANSKLDDLTKEKKGPTTTTTTTAASKAAIVTRETTKIRKSPTIHKELAVVVVKESTKMDVDCDNSKISELKANEPDDNNHHSDHSEDNSMHTGSQVKHISTDGLEMTKKNSTPLDEGTPEVKITETSEPMEIVEEKSPAKRKRRHKNGLVDGLDISIILDPNSGNDGNNPIRQSRRIALQKIKEETNRRQIEDQMLKQMKADAVKKKKDLGIKVSDEDDMIPEDDDDDDDDDDDSSVKSSDCKGDGRKRRRIGGKVLPKGAKPWNHGTSTESSSDTEPDYFVDHYHSEDDRRFPLKSDHEFSPESDLEEGGTNVATIPAKRARTVKKEPKMDGADSLSTEDEELNEDHACQRCKTTDHPEWILLCDGCDKGYHCECLQPVLYHIPEGDWYCPVCQHQQLVDKLVEKLQEFDALVIQLDEARAAKLEEETTTRLANAAAAKEQQRIRREERELNRRNRRKNRKRDDTDSGRRRSQSDRSDSSSDSEDDDDEDDDEDDDDDDDGSSKAEIISSRKTTSRSIRKKLHRVRSLSSSSQSSSDNRNGSDAGGQGRRRGGSDSSTTDSEDMPIYKLRRRAASSKISYKFSEYDNLIDSAIRRELCDDEPMPFSRGKDINVIIQAVNEAENEAKIAKKLTEEDDKEEVKRDIGEDGQEDKDDSNNESGDKSERLKQNGSPDILGGKQQPRGPAMKKKKKKKLSQLDVSSEDEDDDSDEDFKGASASSEEEEDDDEDEDDNSLSENSESSLDLPKRRKPKRSTAGRNRFIEYSDEDEEEVAIKSSRKRKRKLLDDSDEELDMEEEDSEEFDSEDLCSDTETDSNDSGSDSSSGSGSSDGDWRRRRSKAKSKKKSKVKRRPLVAKHSQMPAVKRPPVKKPMPQQQMRAESSDGSPRLSKQSSTDRSDNSKRKTRGKKIHYLVDEDFESSDDGIRPGVQRPDTPPEERALFIKRQEEIKRMLAESNAAKAKELAISSVNATVSSKTKDSLSDVPVQVIESARELDIEFLKSSKNVDDYFDDELPDDFDPEDVDDEALAKIMEEEDFAHHQLKLPVDEPVSTTVVTAPVATVTTTTSVTAPAPMLTTAPAMASTTVSVTLPLTVPVVTTVTANVMTTPTKSRKPTLVTDEYLPRTPFKMMESSKNCDQSQQQTSAAVHAAQRIPLPPMNQPPLVGSQVQIISSQLLSPPPLVRETSSIVNLLRAGGGESKLQIPHPNTVIAHPSALANSPRPDISKFYNHLKQLQGIPPAPGGPMGISGGGGSGGNSVSLKSSTIPIPTITPMGTLGVIPSVSPSVNERRGRRKKITPLREDLKRIAHTSHHTVTPPPGSHASHSNPLLSGILALESRAPTVPGISAPHASTTTTTQGSSSVIRQHSRTSVLSSLPPPPTQPPSVCPEPRTPSMNAPSSVISQIPQYLTNGSLFASRLASLSTNILSSNRLTSQLFSDTGYNDYTTPPPPAAPFNYYSTCDRPSSSHLRPPSLSEMHQPTPLAPTFTTLHPLEFQHGTLKPAGSNANSTTGSSNAIDNHSSVSAAVAGASPSDGTAERLSAVHNNNSSNSSSSGGVIAGAGVGGGLAGIGVGLVASGGDVSGGGIASEAITSSATSVTSTTSVFGELVSYFSSQQDDLDS